MKSKIKTPHDTLFWEYYANVGGMAEFLEYNLPEDVAGDIDFRTLTPNSESFVSDELKPFFTDRIYEGRFKDGRDATIYILLVHRKALAPICAVQILRYMAMRWEDAAINELARELPVVIPLVVYHGKRIWAGKQLKDLFPRGMLDRFIPGYEMIVFDLSKILESEIKGSLECKAVLFFLKILQDRQPDARLAEFFQQLILAQGPDSAMKAVNIFLRYIYEVRGDITLQRIFTALAKVPEGEMIMRNVAVEYSPDAYQQGIEKGIQEGIFKGELMGKFKGKQLGLREGVFKSLLSVLSSRFGSLHPGMVSKLEGITDSNLLTVLIPLAVTAGALREFEQGLDSVLDDAGN